MRFKSLAHYFKKAELILAERYKVIIEEKLGTGSFAFVYKGIGIKSGEFVAVKNEPLQRTARRQKFLNIERKSMHS